MWAAGDASHLEFLHTMWAYERIQPYAVPVGQGFYRATGTKVENTVNMLILRM